MQLTFFSLDTDAASQRISHSYPNVGAYIINITAYNLHSEDFGFNKFIHNMTRIVKVQRPVSNWVLNLGDPAQWIDKDGGIDN